MSQHLLTTNRIVILENRKMRKIKIICRISIHKMLRLGKKITLKHHTLKETLLLSMYNPKLVEAEY
jgi:hypothetical protein